MKALSLKQPLAWAIMNLPTLHQNIILDLWDTEFRGECYIHASGEFDASFYHSMCQLLEKNTHKGFVPSEKQFVQNAIIGKVTISNSPLKNESVEPKGFAKLGFENIKIFLQAIPYEENQESFEVDEEKIMNFIKNEVYGYVCGSCLPDLSWVSEQLNVDESDVEDALLDLGLEPCQGCGWWHESFELSENEDGDFVCDDCLGDHSED
jgi:hypothetical protein